MTDKEQKVQNNNCGEFVTWKCELCGFVIVENTSIKDTDAAFDIQRHTQSHKSEGIVKFTKTVDKDPCVKKTIKTYCVRCKSESEYVFFTKESEAANIDSKPVEVSGCVKCIIRKDK